MSYPFTKGKNWAECIEEMNGIGVVFCTKQIPGPDGKPMTVTYFENKMHGKIYRQVVDITEPTEILMPTTLRVICRGLHIHPKVFGLNLG